MLTGLPALIGTHTVQTVMMGAAILGIVAGVLGSFAVLRRQSLLGDALAHATLPGVCLGFLWAGSRDLGAIMAGAFLTGALAALAVLLIARRTRLKTDAALGIVLGVFFAAGVVLLTLIQGRGGAAQAGLTGFLFGQAAAMLRADIPVMGGVAATALAVVALIWKELKLATFDPDFARAIGLPVLALEVALTLMIAVAIVVGLQLVGVVLMTAMLIAPAAAARQWVRRLGPMVVLAAGFGILAGVGGALISATTRGLATGPVIVLIATGLVVVSILAAPGRGLIAGWLARRRAQAELEDRQVLATMAGLARAHDNPAYPVEQGMLDAAHGQASARTLAGLEARGLVEAADHAPEQTPHWRLTEAGRAAARNAEAGP